MVRKAILTSEQRVHRHISQSPYCEVCHNEVETWWHALRNYFEARLVWQDLYPAALQDNFFTQDSDEWFVTNLQNGMLIDGNVPWNVIFGITCWKLCKWRNERVFTSNITMRKCCQIRTIANEYYRLTTAISCHFHEGNRN